MDYTCVAVVSPVYIQHLFKRFSSFLIKSINLSCLFCPSVTLPVQTLLRSWTSSGP